MHINTHTRAAWYIIITVITLFHCLLTKLTQGLKVEQKTKKPVCLAAVLHVVQ